MFEIVGIRYQHDPRMREKKNLWCCGCNLLVRHGKLKEMTIGHVHLYI